MIVKRIFESLKSLKKRGMVSLVALLSVFVLAVLEVTEDRPQESVLLDQQTELAIRGIGDQLLRQAGDTQTPVPPVEYLNESTLRLGFSTALKIKPDSLARLSLRRIDESLATRFIVNVREVESQKTVYAFEIDRKGEHDIPCLGRWLTAGDYHIDFHFYDQPKAASNYQLSMMGVAGFALLFLAFQGITERKKEQAGTDGELQAGGFEVDRAQSCLYFKEEQILLTNKELKLAVLLFENVGKLVTRDYLVEQIWAKEGVVTGRSLDMFISRLRKKLALNPKMKITNQHGKGYVLMVE